MHVCCGLLFLTVIFQLVFKLTSTFMYFIAIATCPMLQVSFGRYLRAKAGSSDSGAGSEGKTGLGFCSQHFCLNTVDAKGRSRSALVIGFRSQLRGAILGSFCLFFSYLRLFFVHDKLSIIKAALRSRASSLSPQSSRPVPAVMSLYLRWLAGHQRARRQNKVVCSLSAA